MSFLCNNVAVVAVGLLVSLLGWLYGGTRGGLLLPLVPWLFVFMIETIVCFPQREPGETTYDARERVWRALRKDPLVWISFGFLALLLVPFVNNGLCPVCDAVQIAQGADPNPPVPFLPFCVDRIDHLNVVYWFMLALPAMVAVKHCLVAEGKRLLLEIVAWNGAALAVLGFVQSASGALGPYWIAMHKGATGRPGEFFSTFGYPNMAGDYFTTLFGISIALWRDRLNWIHEEERGREASHEGKRASFWSRHYLLIPALVCFYAALNTLSRAAIILATIGAAVYFLHAFISFVSRLHRAVRVKVGAVSIVAVALVLLCSNLCLPKEFKREVDTLGTTEVLDRVTGRGQYHVRIATEIWKDYPLFGCGGWGYIHCCLPRMTAEDRKQQQMVGGINVHNDYLQFLAEHGTVGFGALVAIVVLLLLPVTRGWRKLARQCRFLASKQKPPRPVQIFALPAPAFCLLFAALSTLIHAFGDCPLRSPAVLTLFFVTLAAVPGFMPESKEY